MCGSLSVAGSWLADEGNVELDAACGDVAHSLKDLMHGIEHSMLLENEQGELFLLVRSVAACFAVAALQLLTRVLMTTGSKPRAPSACRASMPVQHKRGAAARQVLMGCLDAYPCVCVRGPLVTLLHGTQKFRGSAVPSAGALVLTSGTASVVCGAMSVPCVG